MQQLEQLYTRGRTHELIYHTHQILSQHQAAPQIVKLTLQALVDAGLGGPARELIQLRGDLPLHEQDVAKLVEQVDSLPHGRCRWQDRAEVFAGNLAVLRERDSLSSMLLESVEASLSGMHLFVTQKGEHLLSSRQAGAMRQWTPPLSSRQTERDVQLPAHGELGPLGIVGVADGELLVDIARLTRDVFLTHSHPIYIVEPDVARFAAWLHCADQRELLGQARILFFVGADAISQVQTLLESDPNLPLPQQFITLSGDGETMQQLQEQFDALAQARLAELESITAELREREQDRDSAYWSDRWQKQGLVLGITSRFTTVLQYSTRATLQAFEQLGHATDLVIEPSDYHTLSPLSIARRLRELDPDLIVLLDHLRYEHPYMPQRTPMLSWIQDPLPNLMKPEAGTSVGEFDFVSGYHQRRCIEEFGYSAERFFGHLIPVSESVFHPGPVHEAVAEQLAGDLCFVGHLTQPASAFHQKLREDVPEVLVKLIDSCWEDVQRRLAQGDYLMQSQMESAVHALAEQQGIKLSTQDAAHLADFGLFRMYDLAFREQTLEWAARWARSHNRRLRVFGNGWEQLPRIAPFAVGPVEHGEALRSVYRTIPLVLQINPSGFLNQRSYEALLSGALVLVRYTPNNFAGLSVRDFEAKTAAGESLVNSAVHVYPQLARVVFHDADELAVLTEQYLGDAKQRAALHEEFARITRQQYTYTNLMRWLRDEIGNQLARQAASLTEQALA
jgi:hypothetical protein